MVDARPGFVRLIPLALALLGAALYANTLSNEFVFDTTGQVEQAGEWSLARPLEIVAGTRRPVVNLSFAINYALGGESPAGYHAFNALVHILAGLTLYGLVRRTLRLPSLAERYGDRAELVGGAVAALWLAHPLNTQAVSYVVQRGESMMALCFLLTLYGLNRAATAGGGAARTGWGVVSVGACVLGMGCKEVMAVAPVVALLYDRAFMGGAWRAVASRRWALHAGLFGTLALLPVMGFADVAGDEASAGFGLKLVTWHEYLRSQGEVMLHYVRLAVWPAPLVLDYMWPPATLTGRTLLGIPAWVLPSAAVGLAVLASVVGVVRNAWWGFLGFSYFAILAPTSSVIPIADLAVEHRMYLPLVCVVVAVVVGADAVVRRVPHGETRRVFALVALLVPLGVLSSLTLMRNYEYVTKVAVWTTVTERAPNNPRGWHNLGRALFDAGHYERAMAAYEMTLRLVPDFDEAHDGIGNIWVQLGDYERAIERYRKAVALKPTDHEYAYNLGRAYLLAGRLDEAEAELSRAIELKSGYANALNLMGVVWVRWGEHERAVEWFERAIAAEGEHLEARTNLTKAWVELGRLDRAAEAAAGAVEVARRMGVAPEVLRQMEASLEQLRAAASRQQGEPAPASP